MIRARRAAKISYPQGMSKGKGKAETTLPYPLLYPSGSLGAEPLTPFGSAADTLFSFLSGLPSPFVPVADGI